MKRFNFLTAALALLAVVSCNKAGGDTPEDVSISGQVKSYSWKAFQNGDVGNGPEVIPHAGTDYIFTYNPDGKVASLETVYYVSNYDASGKWGLQETSRVTSTYTWNGNVCKVSENGRETVTMTFEGGLLVKEESTAVGSARTTTFRYDGSRLVGYTVQLESGATEYEYVWENGDVTEIKVGTQTYKYAYSSDPNPFAGTFDVAFDNFGVGYKFLAYGFTGSRNAHKMTGCTPDNHPQQDVYTYTLNSKGQVTKIRRGTPESGFYQDVDIKYYD